MNRIVKEATVERFYYKSNDQSRTHLADYMAVYNLARWLKTLSGPTPYEYITKIGMSEQDQFIVNLIHQMPGLKPNEDCSVRAHGDCDVENPSADAADQFTFTRQRLEMQLTLREGGGGKRVIVLHECAVDAKGGERLAIVGFDEPTAAVAKTASKDEVDGRLLRLLVHQAEMSN